MTSTSSSPRASVVLVHRGFVDGSRRPGRPFLQWCRDHRGRNRTQDPVTRLHRRLRPGQGRISRDSHRQPGAGGSRSADRSDGDGLLFLGREKFRASFAADVSPKLAAFMADSPVPWGVEALNGAVTDPAWRVKPSWYLVASDDHMIPPRRSYQCSRCCQSGGTRPLGPGTG